MKQKTLQRKEKRKSCDEFTKTTKSSSDSISPNVIKRTILSIVMISFFIFINYCNIFYLIVFVIALTISVLIEIISIAKTPQGYPFNTFIISGFTGIIYLYYLSESLSLLFPSSAIFLLFFKRRYFYIYISCLIIFVSSLKPGKLKNQFALFSLVHLSSYVVSNSCKAALHNLQIGKFWLFFPSTLVICNDIFAYIIGKIFGKTPLFRLSPKKTLEGFLGGFIFTLIYGFIFCNFQLRYNIFSDLYNNELSDIYSIKFYKCSFQITYMYIHCMVFVFVASFIAPFSGFFASALKRAYNKKDFGNSIPGHGGLTDRFDCQCIMVLFTTVYLKTFLRTKEQALNSCYFYIITSFTNEEINLLLLKLQNNISNTH